MRRIQYAWCIVVALISNDSLASEREDQAKSFANIYVTLCMKNLFSLEAFKQQLQSLPKFPPEQAARFLEGNTGDAWPVPDKHGLFVLAIPSNNNTCAIHGRRADAKTLKKLFDDIASTAPSPMIATKKTSETKNTTANGLVETVDYLWSHKNESRKIQLKLSTSTLETAEIQALATAAIIKD